MRRGFIRAHRGESGPIGKACETPRVSRSECCDCLNRPKSSAQTGREALEGFVAGWFEPHKGRYGYRRINRGLGRDGIVVSERRVLAAMRGPGPGAKGATRRRGRAKPAGKGGPRASLVNRVFDVDAGNRLWVGDITHIDTDGGRLCLAAAMDARHRKVVGCSMSGKVTGRLPIDALGQAVGREGPPDGFSPAFHDDRGSQYTSRALQGCLESHGVARSMSRPGNPRGDAVAESFFKALKRELVNDGRYRSGDEARREVLRYTEPCCNRQRLHSKNGYMAPCDLERDAA